MNDECITVRIIKELMVLKDTSDVSSEQFLFLAQRTEIQGAKAVVLEKIKNAKGFDSIRRNRQEPGENRQQSEGIKEKKVMENSKYCGMSHPQKQCPAYDKMCSGCGKVSYYKAV